MNLDWWFKAQDQVMARNRSEIEDEYRWLNAAVGLLTDVQQFVNTNPNVQSLRLREEEQDTSKHRASNVVINLVNDALGAIVNASRLLLFGGHADAFALVRSAFEACSYAEYFAVNPQKVEAYMELEALISGPLPSDLEINLGNDLRRHGLQIGTILKALKDRDGQPREGLYARLCNLGSHPSPKRVGLRLSAPGGAVLAAVSASTPEWSRANWTRGCASDLTAVTKYAVEMPFDHYPDWFRFDRSLEERCTSLAKEYYTLNKP